MELNGDLRLAALDRWRYVSGNLLRNIGRSSLRPKRFAPGPADARGAPSPSRALTHLFFDLELAGVRPPGRLRVLEIGCGSGSLAGHLARLGYGGEYVGVDLGNRFAADAAADAAFARTFHQMDIHEFRCDRPFDLILSVSALEHIPDDDRLVRRLGAMLTPDGAQVHLLPSGWGLAAYLWHGWRQYPTHAIERLFDMRRTTVWAIGGAGSLALHVLFITVPELLLRSSFRGRWPEAYSRMLRCALRIDRYLPWTPVGYAVVERARG